MSHAIETSFMPEPGAQLFFWLSKLHVSKRCEFLLRKFLMRMTLNASKCWKFYEKERKNFCLPLIRLGAYLHLILFFFLYYYIFWRISTLLKCLIWIVRIIKMHEHLIRTSRRCKKIHFQYYIKSSFTIWIKQYFWRYTGNPTSDVRYSFVFMVELNENEQKKRIEMLKIDAKIRILVSQKFKSKINN